MTSIPSLPPCDSSLLSLVGKFPAEFALLILGACAWTAVGALTLPLLLPIPLSADPAYDSEFDLDKKDTTSSRGEGSPEDKVISWESAERPMCGCGMGGGGVGWYSGC
jgi:hypothetical protein